MRRDEKTNKHHVTLFGDPKGHFDVDLPRRHLFLPDWLVTEIRCPQCRSSRIVTLDPFSDLPIQWQFGRTVSPAYFCEIASHIASSGQTELAISHPDRSSEVIFVGDFGDTRGIMTSHLLYHRNMKTGEVDSLIVTSLPIKNRSVACEWMDLFYSGIYPLPPVDLAFHETHNQHDEALQ